MLNLSYPLIYLKKGSQIQVGEYIVHFYSGFFSVLLAIKTLHKIFRNILTIKTRLMFVYIQVYIYAYIYL